MNENERENFWKDVFILFDKENKGTIHFNLIHNYLQSVGIVIEKKEINKEELKYIMTNLGDKISEEEAETILSNFKIENGEIDYMEFLNKYNINE